MKPVPASLDKPRSTEPSPSARYDCWFFSAILLLALYYNWYRYPFSINNAGTSPTYGDTPEWISTLKYIVIAFMLMAYGAYRVLSPGTAAPTQPNWTNRLLLASICLGLFVWSSLCFIVTGNSYFFRDGMIFLIPLVVVLVLRASRAQLLQAFGMQFLVFLWLSLLVQYGEVVLWLALGWLPALGYPDSIFTRFGSVWDDPNGYGLIIAFLIPFAVERYTGWLRWGVVIALVGALLLTQSLTALAAVLGAWLIGNAIQLAASGRATYATRVLTTLVFSAAAALAALSFDRVRELLMSFAAMKEQSITIHSASGSTLSDLPLGAWLGVNPSGKIGESGWVNLLTSPGIAFVLLYLVVLMRAAIRLEGSARDYRLGATARACAAGGFYFLLAYMLGMINLPFDNVFPVNLIAVFFVAIAEIEVARFERAKSNLVPGTT